MGLVPTAAARNQQTAGLHVQSTSVQRLPYIVTSILQLEVVAYYAYTHTQILEGKSDTEESPAAI